SQIPKPKPQTTLNPQIPIGTSTGQEDRAPGSASGRCDSGIVCDLDLGVCDFEPKVSDFGLARVLDQERAQSRTGEIVCTPACMAPEQAGGPAGEVGPAADIYALGAILYEALTGRPPFMAAAVLDTLEQVRTLDPVPPRRLQPGVPRDLDTICMKCLQKAP